MRSPLPGALLVLSVSALDANAVGWQTRLNCASDYYAYCSQHAVGSAALRKCMRDNGPRLSKSCVNALISDGEISKAEVERQKEKITAAKAKSQSKTEPQKEAKKDTKADTKSAAKTEIAPKKSKVAERTKGSDPAKADAAASGKVQTVALPVPKSQIAPEREAGLLDQETYEALKRRVHHFLADPDTLHPVVPQFVTEQEALAETDSVNPAKTEATIVAPIPMEPTENTAEADVASEPVNSELAAPELPTAAVSEPETGSEVPADDKNVEKAVTPPSSERVKKTTKSSPGYSSSKMSLGKKSAAEKSAPEVPPNAQSWNDYMERRFEGGLNYEGLGARFSN